MDPSCLNKNSVTANGSVKQEHNVNLEVACSLSSTDFPFEENECEFEFGSVVYSPDMVIY